MAANPDFQDDFSAEAIRARGEKQFAEHFANPEHQAVIADRQLEIEPIPEFYLSGTAAPAESIEPAQLSKASHGPRLTAENGAELSSQPCVLSDFLEKPFPAKEPLIEGLLYRRDNCTAVGRRRNGKTTLAENLALALTLPKPDFLGYPIPEARRATAFFLEDDPRELQEKLKLMKGNGDTDDRFWVATKDDFISNKIQIAVTNVDFQRRVLKICDGSRPDLVIFDNVSHLVGADYNDSKKIHQLVLFSYELNRRYNCAVLFLAHPRKQKGDVGSRVKLTDDPEQFFEETLGSSHMINSTGALWGVQRLDEATYFVGGAQRYTGQQGAMALQLGDDGWFVVSDDFHSQFELVVNTEKRRLSWSALPETFTFSEAYSAAQKYLASKNSFSAFWKELKLKKLIVAVDLIGSEGRFRKAARVVAL